MNAITMKLENKQPLVSSSKNKVKDSVVGKKSKNHRKKSSLASTDKDALLSDHGLGCLSGERNYDLNDSKSNNLSELSSTKKSRPKKVCPKRNDKMLTTSGTMHERLQQILSPEVRDKITSILNEVKTLSDVEKLFLYLQLPTGSPFEADPFKIKYQNPLGKKAEEEGMIAITWIQSHLEEDPEVSLPKQEVYDEYQAYCQMTGRDALCAADFGKVMKQIFPSVKPRRLGTRGNSRYCYSGLRKKLKLKSPILPDMNAESESSDLANENIKDEVTSAACHILFEWAEKLLGIKFTSLKELASHLLENMYVDNRSVAAFTVLLEGAPQLMEKGFSNYEGGVKKSDAQVHLQRKIQEKELIKEQKKKLQEQRSNLTAASKNKLPLTKKKSTKSKKSKLPIEKSDLSSNQDKKFEDLFSKGLEETSLMTEVENTSLEIDTNAFETQIKEEDMDMELVVDMELVMNDATSSSNVSSQISTSKSVDNDQNSGLQTEDTPTKKSKIILPRSKTPVCISQTLPNIIIVPSLPSLSQLTEINKPSLIAPKYKRIQPKPLKEECFSSVARSRAGSLGSTTVIKPKTRTNDGRHSSHAWLQSASSPEGSDHNNSKTNSDCTANVTVTSLDSSPQKSNLKRNCFIVPKDKVTEKLKSDIHFSPEGQNSSAFSDIKVLASTACSQLSNESTTGSILKSNSLNKSSLPFRESNVLKRPLDDSEKALKTKKMLLDTNTSDEVSAITFPVTQELSSAIKSSIPVQRPSIQQNSTNEEVSIYEIEGDALNDYYRGSNSQALFTTSIQQMESKDCDTKRRQLDLNKDISQLRMLLEQKMSCGQTNSTILNSLKNDMKTESSSHTQKGRISFSNTLSSEDSRLSNEQLQTASKFSLNSLCNNNIVSLSFDDDKQIKNISQLDSIEKFLDCHLNQQNRISDQDELISNAEMYLNSARNNSQQIELELSDFQQGLVESNNGLLSNADLISNIEYTPHENSFLPMRVNTYTQVPSVPQSPNTRRRAFNFMPISPSHTPVPDNVNIGGASTVSSPVPNQYPRNMMSIGVGPSQPPSNAGSPFVSPRSTPVSTCRSRHSSGQSTSRHTPFQNFDSGVSSVSSSPFISPQPTPVPVSRLRHNSSHASNKTVTFCSVNSPHVINSLSTTNSLGQLRSRHNSGPGGPHMSGSLCTKNTPLSPLVSDHGATSSFVFPPGNEIRFRHNSDSNTTSLSPVSEQTSSSSSCTSNLPDLTSVNELSHSFLNDSAADLLINGNSSNFKQVRQRHASSSVIYSKPYLATKDPFSAEIQNLLKHDQMNGVSNNPLSNRSQSVPLHQMLPNFNTYCFYQNPVDDTTIKSHPTTPVMNQVFTFPLLNSNQENAALPAEVLNGDKSFSQATQIEWSNLEGTGDLEVSSARRNLTTLLDPPLSDDLQTTLEDLRDCDNDFSKFAQELELSQTEDGSL